MPRVSPTAEGFRAAFRRPSFTLAEITWRWVVGATATALFFFGLFEFLNTLPVSKSEMLFLRSRQPYLVAQAILHILRGGLSRAVLSMLVAVLLMTLLWMIAGSLGRIATVRALIEYFRTDIARKLSAGSGTEGRELVDGSSLSLSPSTYRGNSFQPLASLNFLRAAVVLAMISGFMGAAILAGFASPKAHPRPGLAFVLFLPMAALIGLVGWALNWLLSLAGIFAVRDDDDAVGAISAAVALCGERTGAVLAVSSWTGLAHLVAFVGATIAVSMPLGLMPVVPWRLAMLAMLAVTLVYFALADWLYMARLAGYVCITETPEALLAPLPPVPPPPPPAPLQTTIDRDELILSDLPNLAVEM
jgi:hypothetical protein